MVSGWVVGILVLVAFLVGAGTSVGAGVLMTRLFTPKPTKAEKQEIKERDALRDLEERAWAEGFNHPDDYLAYLDKIKRGERV